MISMNLDRLQVLAAAFRKAIERCDKRRLPLSFETFPRGSCGDTTTLLGTFLIEQGIGTFQYICGERGVAWADWHSHAWLEAEGVIVDITADQFPERTEKVIVATRSDWHATFDCKALHKADFRSNSRPVGIRLGKAYQAILEKMI